MYSIYIHFHGTGTSILTRVAELPDIPGKHGMIRKYLLGQYNYIRIILKIITSGKIRKVCNFFQIF